MTELLRRLAEPFDPSIVSFRVGSTNQDKTKGMALAYIDARDVMNRLDAVVGPANWQDDYPWSDGKRVVCRIGIKLDGEWVWKTDGAGDTDYEGEKGALSDAFKRGAVKWGIGRYLYDLDSPWVQVEQKGKSFIIVPAELVKLRSRLPRPAVPMVKGERTTGASEDDEIDRSRLRFKSIKDSLQAAPSEVGLDQIWSTNKADIEIIRKHGGESAMALLHDADQKRRDELRAKAAA